ncbi:S53 family peptidase [Undibacterium luofuense]|uniref:S53 family peptidase n=1 Tax=Undibacterium luofuense TaxID=2828733 RepID=A0A941DJ30_9BURK|nr:S53 family peptidase [Undibacterium luofuense]MBR7781668.1 S53 family peptidase [Undibacterium luofuense]
MTISSYLQPKTFSASTITLATITAIGLAGCGGSSTPTAQQSNNTTAAGIATATTSFTVQVPAETTVPAEAQALTAAPTFHVAPVLLNEPSDADQLRPGASASMPAHTQSISAALQSVSTRGLTVSQIARKEFVQTGSASAARFQPAAGITAAVTTYTPAQVRAAYNLPALPASFTGLTAAQLAQFGAGQTIYIVDAYHNPNAAAELAAFNTKFGLPGCTTKQYVVGTALPLAAPAANTCEFAIAYNTAAGGLSNTAPAYNSGWATEISLDVQWAHAIAPLARIVLIEAPDASINSLVGGVNLANVMGPGAVSMSFGAAEGTWTSSVDTAFANTKMTYLAATGDNGMAVSWPSVSTKVLAVGGTSLTYSGTGTRSEAAWSGTGGGISAYTATPSYQTSVVPGMGTPVRRTVADVSMNANPNTGQYVAVINPGSTTVNWISAGGTSMSTPQWAGIVAMANAVRTASGKAVVGQTHNTLYQTISTNATNYAKGFLDVTTGTHGTCGTCSAKTGFDQLTGLGTPNVTNLLTLLNDGGTVAAPIVNGASISGTTGTPLTFTASVSAVNPVTYSLTGAPAGMTITTAGVVSWSTPVAGTYSVTVKATDTKTGLTGQGVYTVTVTAPPPPTVTAGTVTGMVGQALSYTVAYTAPNPVTFTLTGAPSGMTISSAGVISWTSPVLGTFNVTVTAKDSKTGFTASAVVSVKVSAVPAPVVTGKTVSTLVGATVSETVAVTAYNPVTYKLTGAPTGMSISTAGVISWVPAAAGTYTVTVTATDSKTGLSGSASVVFNVAANGITINAPAITGSVGKALSGSISITDPGAAWVSVSISGVPLGMSFSMTGLTINSYWGSPVAGTYSLKITVTDSAGKTATTTQTITIK